MNSQRPDVLLHPIRLRIVLAVAADEVTTSDIASRLDDVPQATLYRQVRVLVTAGMLEVVSERRVRGGFEKTYRVNAASAGIRPAEAATMSPEEHLRVFTVFSGSLIQDYARYLTMPGAAPHKDGVSLGQYSLVQSMEEFEAMMTEIAEVVKKYGEFDAAPDRRQRLLSLVAIPRAVDDT